MLEAHRAIVRRNLTRFRGREVQTTGDGFLATFDVPACGVRCACAIVDEINPLGIELRAGLHTGECEMIGDDVNGIAVHTGARVAALAGSGEILVSGTVKDVVAGSGLRFSDRGIQSLKGIPGEWRIFAVQDCNWKSRGPTPIFRPHQKVFARRPGCARTPTPDAIWAARARIGDTLWRSS